MRCRWWWGASGWRSCWGCMALVDMVIPRGSKALVEYVQANTRIPVLGHAEGVCHIYVDRAADEALALR